MNSPIPSVNELSRPAKALIDSGKAPAFGDAAQLLAEACPTIVAGPDAVTYAHHAALLTAVETTARTFGQVPVHLPTSVAETDCTVPGVTDITLAEAVLRAGGHLIGTTTSTTAPRIVIGTVKTTRELTLQVSWDHWIAHVSTAQKQLPERGNMVLAPVAAAALAVAECFKRALGVEEACHRSRSLNLWQSDYRFESAQHAALAEDVLGPILRHLPSAVWMVGLGHLGQAYAWCWRFLPYVERSKCEIHLQDYDRVNSANRSTGMFIRPGDEGQTKPRVVSAALERAGFATRIIERRLLPETQRHADEPALALVGVDKLEPRRLISGIGWALAVDVGLGAGPSDFTGISLHTFPAPTSSHDVPAWQGLGPTGRAARAQRQNAYQEASSAGADACGLVQLAEIAVAAPFVGVVAAALALAEPLRVLHGQNPNITLAFDAGRNAPPRSTGGDTRPRISFQAALPT